MKLYQELQTAIRRLDAVKVGEICDELRFTHGMTYNQIAGLVEELGCSPDDMEELLCEADRLSSLS